MNYTSLQADVADFLHRSDLSAVMPGFIERAEAAVFRELRLKDLALSVAGTTTGEYADLPTDFASASRVTIVIGSTEVALDYRSEPVNGSTTYPTSYSLENNKLRIFGAGTGQAYTLYYIPAIPPLSVSVTTNWITDNAPDLYLYATAVEAARYMQDDALVNSLSGYVVALLDSVRRMTEKKGQPANGSLQIKARR